jgi:hypothetical protein
LPAVYLLRYFIDGGGLASYGVDQRDPSRRAASYVDRRLGGRAGRRRLVETEMLTMTDNRGRVLLGAVFCVLGIILSGSPAAAQDARSANYWLPHCKEFSVAKYSALSFSCAGQVLALMQTGPLLRPTFAFCVPSGVTGEQATQVVVRILEAEPEKLQESFVGLAMGALRQTWPCL